MNIGSVIKYYRTKYQLTQAQLADGICSISHLSKIESNTYVPHESTIEALMAKMGVQWEKEMHRHKRLERQIGEFIDCSLFYDLEHMRKQYKQLEKENDYIQSSELVNQYELYKFRFYIYENDHVQAEQQKELIDRMKGSFTAPEKWLHQFFLSIYYTMLNKTEKALGFLEQLEQGIQSIPQKFEGEYYYQKARLLILFDRFELSAYYAEMAVQYYQLHHNYIRLLHAQLLLAINYTRRNLLVQASGLYEVLKRNAHLMGQKDLYYQTLYNLAELFKQKKDYDQAFELLAELKVSLPDDSYIYKAVLISMIEATVEMNQKDESLLRELKLLTRETADEYFLIYENYFEKRMFSQPDLIAYCEEKMFPFFRKNGYIKEGKKVATELKIFYEQKKDWEKANFYRSYEERKAGEV